MYPYTISFVIPALNEEKVVGVFVAQVIERVRGRFKDYEVILVNDGSTDSTGPIMDGFARANDKVRVIHNARNIGFGSSFERGLREARFEYVMLLCGDGGFPAASLPPVFDQIGTADIVIPWMVNLKEIKSTGRYLLSRTYTALVNLSFGLRLRYYNGLPVHRKDLLEKISITSNGFGFQAEILVKLLRSGASYVEVGVNGAEETKQSDALRMKNWLGVGSTVYHLVREVSRFTRLRRAFATTSARSADKERSR
jgi:dolichol-phosphate mannosyltransferase